MSTKEIVSDIREKLNDLARERQELLERLDEINGVFQSLGIDPDRGTRRAGLGRGRRTAARGRGLRPGGQRVQGVKQTLLESLTSTPQSPGELQTKVSKKLGHKVNITTQLHMLKREKLAKAASRGQWVKA